MAWPTGATRLAGVIGDPVRHSLSPVLHNAAFSALGLDWAYLALPVPAGRVRDALAGATALGIEGLSVTMPHKTAVAEALDHLSPTATALRAVNTVVRRDGELSGESTDGQGFLDAVREDPGFDPAGRRCLVIGAGGAARAVVLALTHAGAGEVVVVNRTPDRAAGAVALAGEVGRIGRPEEVESMELVVNATPVGMTPAPPAGDQADAARSGRPLDPAARRAGGQERAAAVPESGRELPLVQAHRLGAGQVVVDLVYHPAATALIEEARRRGATAVNGMGMLVHQAALAFSLWTGERAPVDVMRDAASQVLEPEEA